MSRAVTLERAREILREKGALAAEKKADRDLGSGVIQCYIHTNNQIGTMVELLCETDFVARNEEFIALAKDIAMHCAAFQPRHRSRDDIPEEVMNQIMAELKDDIDAGKPDEVKETILKGKTDAKLKEFVLLEQGFVKDDTRTIKNCIDEAVQKFGERIEIGKFVVWKI